MMLYLITGSLVGTSFRIIFGTKHYPQPYMHDLIANAFGSFIIGYYDNQYLEDWQNMHILISIGICGCMTTFSSWMLQTIKLLVYEQELEATLVLIQGLLAAYGGFKFGKSIKESYNIFKPIQMENIEYFLTGIILLYMIFVVNKIDQSISLSLILCSFGAYLRWKLSKLNKLGWLPLGTLVSNLLAVIIGTFIQKNLDAKLYDPYYYGIIQGFCGSLSTVSTFIRELCGLELQKSIIYMILSFFSICIGLVIY